MQHNNGGMLLGFAVIMAVPYAAEQVSSNGIPVTTSSQIGPPTSDHPLHPGDISPVSTGWVRFEDNSCFYKIVSRPMLGWAAARESCARFADGADLASITDESELRFLSNVAQGNHSTSRNPIPSPWWLGGTSSGPAKFPPPCPKAAMALMVSRCVVVLDSTLWRWSDGSFFDQKRMWGPGEPSAGSVGYCTLQGYDTVGMKHLNMLNDEHCTIRRQYACKWCPELPVHIEPPILPVAKTACAEVKLRDLHGDNPWDAGKEVELQWLSCPKGKGSITAVLFASVGRPYGKCTSKIQSAVTANPYCHADARALVEKECLGKEACSPKVSKALLGEPCAGQGLRFVARVRCGQLSADEIRDAHADELKELVVSAQYQSPEGVKAAEQIRALVKHIHLASSMSAEPQQPAGPAENAGVSDSEMPWGHDVSNVIMPLKLCRGKESSVGGPPCSCKTNCALCRNHKHKTLKTCFRCSNGKILDGKIGSKVSMCVNKCPEQRPNKYGNAENGFFCGEVTKKLWSRKMKDPADPIPYLCLGDGKTALGRKPCMCPKKCEICTVLGTASPVCYRCSVGFDLGIAGADCKRDTTQLGVKRTGGSK